MVWVINAWCGGEKYLEVSQYSRLRYSSTLVTYGGIYKQKYPYWINIILKSLGNRIEWLIVKCTKDGFKNLDSLYTHLLVDWGGSDEPYQQYYIWTWIYDNCSAVWENTESHEGGDIIEKASKYKKSTVKYRLSAFHCIPVYKILHRYMINTHNWTSRKLTGRQSEWFKQQTNSELSFHTLDRCSLTNQADIEWLCLFFHGLLPPARTWWHPVCSPDSPLTGIKRYVITFLHTYYYFRYFLCIWQPQEPRIATIPPPTPARKPSDKAVLLIAPGHPRYPPAFDDDDAILQWPLPIRQIHLLPTLFRVTEPTQYQHWGKLPSSMSFLCLNDFEYSQRCHIGHHPGSRSIIPADKRWQWQRQRTGLITLCCWTMGRPEARLAGAVGDAGRLREGGRVWAGGREEDWDADS